MTEEKLDKAIEINHIIQRLGELKEALLKNEEHEQQVPIEINKLATNIPNETFEKLAKTLDEEIERYKSEFKEL